MAMLLRKRSKVALRHVRSVSYALDGYFSQAPLPSDPHYQTEMQRRLEARLKARQENFKATQELGRLEVVPEIRTDFPPTKMEKMNPKPLTKMIPIKRVRTGLVAKKLGMMRLYDEHA